MKIQISGNKGRLLGNWTLTGITSSEINDLSTALQKLESESSKKIELDCRGVGNFDATGKQILDVWLQCARFRGVEPELINPPGILQSAFKRAVPQQRGVRAVSNPKNEFVPNGKSLGKL